MKFRTIILVYNKKAFVFTLTHTPHIYVRSEPVYITALEISELTEALEKVYKAGNPKVLIDDPDSLIKADELTVKYTGAKSRRQLEKNSFYYLIVWRVNEISISTSEYGELEASYRRRRELPLDTDMRTVAQIILEDALSRPEVLNPPVIIPKPRKKRQPQQGTDSTASSASATKKKGTSLRSKALKMLTSTDTLTIADAMRVYAEDAVELAKRGFNVTLDFSEDSLKILEEILELYHKELPPKGAVNSPLGKRPSDEEIWQVAKGWGGYLGEVIRRKWGGEWVLQSTKEPATTATLEVSGIVMWPIARAYKRLVNGDEDNIWAYYQVLKRDLEAKKK